MPCSELLASTCMLSLMRLLRPCKQRLPMQKVSMRELHEDNEIRCYVDDISSGRLTSIQWEEHGTLEIQSRRQNIHPQQVSHLCFRTALYLPDVDAEFEAGIGEQVLQLLHGILCPALGSPGAPNLESGLVIALVCVKAELQGCVAVCDQDVPDLQCIPHWYC